MMHGEVVYRRDLYDKVGGYRPFFKFSQDRDLWCRLSREGNIVVLEDVLYKRYANIGGVSGDHKKQLIQRFLSHFTLHCHKAVMAGKKDPLDYYGVQAGLLYQGTMALQKDLIILALRYFLSDNHDAAQNILSKATAVRGGCVATVTQWLLRRFPSEMRIILTKIRGCRNAD